MSTRYQFLPWLRQGAATTIRNADTLGADLPARPALPLKVRVNERSDVPVTLRMYGPGDVTGLDRRAVVRTDPPHLSADFEPNYFPSVEFDAPDLPWMLTPATGDGQGRLRPWLCLVVVRQQAGVSITVDRNRPLPVLAIRSPAIPAEELPNLADSWAWAHCRVLSTDEIPLRDLLADRTRPAPVSGLICPRRLRAGSDYFACVVPAFDIGRKAGMGELIEPADEEQLAPAWNLDDAPETIELPIYFQWEFRTGPEGDFEQLVRRLRGQPVPGEVGKRMLQIGDAAFGLPDAGMLPVEGALRPPNGEASIPPSPAFRDALRDLLNRPDALREAVDNEPLVAPPIYGSWQAAQRRVGENSPAWLREMNLDPRYRAAAGLGTLVVQDQQEQLMASAWEQLGTPGEDPRPIHQRELGREVLSRVHASLAQLSPERFLQVTGPMQARVRLEQSGVIFAGAAMEMTPATALEQIRRSTVPAAVASAAFRRVTRARGPMLRVATGASVSQVHPFAFAAMFESRRRRTPAAVRPLTPDSTVSPSAIEQRLTQLVVPSTMLALASQFNDAVREVTGYLAATTGVPATPERPGLILGQFKALLIEQINPARTLPPPVTSPSSRASGDADAPSLPGPSFPQPMYEALRELAPDMLLPGVEFIPPDSITLLETNPPVIAAYMIGLNHEMSRELLWREYPSDLRGTCFRRFWGGNLAMPEIREWTSDSALGSHVADGSGGEQLVLLLRGALLQRYPDAVIYAVPAIDRRTPGTERRYPLFRAALGPDITCLGFDLSASEVRGGEQVPGWFFAIEQPPGRARFGLDASIKTGGDPAQLANWNDLGWGDMAANDDALKSLTHAPVAGRLLHHRVNELEWGLNAGHMAAITLQRPVRVLQHASELLPPLPTS